MAKHHSSFERAMVLIFLVIGISAWVFSNVDLPQEELTGLAGGGFFEIFDRDLAGMTTFHFGEVTNYDEAEEYLQNRVHELETVYNAIEAANTVVITANSLAAAAPEGSLERQNYLEQSESATRTAQELSRDANSFMSTYFHESDEVRSFMGRADSKSYDDSINEYYDGAVSSARSTYEAYEETYYAYSPSYGIHYDGITAVDSLADIPGYEEIVKPSSLIPFPVYSGYEIEMTYEDGGVDDAVVVLVPRGDVYTIQLLEIDDDGNFQQTTIGETVSQDSIVDKIQEHLIGRGVVQEALLTSITLTDGSEITELGDEATIISGGSEDLMGAVLVESRVDSLLAHGGLASATDGLTTTGSTTADDDDDDADDDDDDPPPEEKPYVPVDTISDASGYVSPTDAETVVEIGVGMDAATAIKAVNWDPSERIISYVSEDGTGLKMDYYIDSNGYPYRVIGEGENAEVQLLYYDLSGGDATTGEGIIYDHEEELLVALALKGDNGLDLSLETFDGTLDGEASGVGISHPPIQDYLARINYQKEQMELSGKGTTIKKVELGKIFAAVLGLSQQIQGLSQADAMLLKEAGMEDDAIRDVYNQIPVQYRGGAAEELIKEVQGINTYLSSTLGKSGWSYHGGSAYSGTLDSGTQVGRSAEGDVWVLIPGDSSGTKLYREGAGLVAKYYTIRESDGSKVYKDRGTVKSEEKKALAEANKQVKQVSAKVEADRRAGKIIGPDGEALTRAGYVQRAQMEVEYKKIEAYNQARFVGLLNSLLDEKWGAWSNGVPSKICAKVFGLEYYKQDGWTRVPENSSAYQIQADLLKNIRTVMIEGEKEEIFEGMYRYAYTIRLLTNSTVQWETYLKNSCTKETSIEVFYDYGLLYQGQHFLYHYAGSQTQDMIFEQDIDPVYLFDTACVQFDDEFDPYCVSLIHGNGFATPDEGSEYGCREYDLEDHMFQGVNDPYVYE
jgi:hypothetical protein